MSGNTKLKQDLLSLKNKKEGTKKEKKENLWIVRPRPIANPKLRLFCLPYAGGSPSVFRTWPDFFYDEQIEICMVQLPGREQRMMDQLQDDFYILVQALLNGIKQPFLTDNVPYAIYGHCMGSLISFELLQHIRALGLKLPIHFIVAAHYAPELLVPETKTTSHLKALKPHEFFAIAEDLGGTDDAIMKDPNTSALLITTLSKEYWMYADYVYRKQDPFDFPITVYYGVRDRLVPRDEIGGWVNETSQKCEFFDVEGDHFFVIKEKENFLPILREKMLEIKAKL